MKIGVMSDTHGNLTEVAAAINNVGIADAWIHLGDIIMPDVGKIQELTNLPVYNVCGNCDITNDCKYEDVIVLNGKRIFITHGHMYDVNTTTKLLLHRARELECDAVLFGHTHQPVLAKDGDILILNPGSTTRPINRPHKSAAILTVGKNDITAEIVTW